MLQPRLPGLAVSRRGWPRLCLRGVAGLAPSISYGPNEPPLLPHTIPEHFASVVSRFGDRPAVISRSPTTTRDAAPDEGIPDAAWPAARETVLTYEALDLVSNSLAHSLRSLGVKKGDRVAVGLGNCSEFAALTYAVFKLGAILVPLNPGFNANQVTAALTHLQARVLIIGTVTDLAYKPCRGRSNLPLLQAMVPDLDASSRKVHAPHVPSLETVIVLDNSASHPLVSFPSSARSLTPFSSLLEGGSLVPRRSAHSARAVTPDSPLLAADTVNIQFTSGTTSQPKATMLSHTNILNNGALIAHRMGLAPADSIVCPPPLFHCFGSVLGYMATATTGAALLFPSPAFDPLASLKMAAHHRATGLYGVATMFVAILEILSSPPKDVSPASVRALPTHLRKGIAAGSSVPESLMRRLYASLGLADLVICYGMTETAPVSCMTTPADPFDRRTGSVGRAMPHTAVKVVDPTDRTRVLPRGDRGELAAAGYLVMQGYWGDEARTRDVRVADPETGTVWLYSGDEARMDEDGYVEITGRIKDLVIRAGENIHPLEIENVLFQHPLVAEASVVAVPDERYGEAVGAFVAVHRGVAVRDGEGVGEEKGKGKVLTRNMVRDWVRDRLSAHLVPKHVFWCDEFPKTASGKIQKFKLRDRARELVAEAAAAGNQGISGHVHT
ncbi:hypothetical protein B0T26DRAFT_736673 [Lasiosphaeria miniovina]|uniref:Acetyl-CoA synthetase-like protein n=1 Tax=Lasiosphaeria miniovina TaxID=1954250 RepID=A0AA40BGK2_9PEZI|nr:uncharacterized protein B0T26DRAFT_736673 [Lasiosphaeria miniovina]KAK0733842.1 hypothetical protein B0T26DRAFT_736673 [Lasiosphaeria miniovina]